MIHSEDGATPLLSPALRYLPSHSSSYRAPSVPLPQTSPPIVSFYRAMLRSRAVMPRQVVCLSVRLSVRL